MYGRMYVWALRLYYSISGGTSDLVISISLFVLLVWSMADIMLLVLKVGGGIPPGREDDMNRGITLPAGSSGHRDTESDTCIYMYMYKSTQKAYLHVYYS